MRERPIIFSGPMVRALLDGSKAQTRRVVKPAGAHHLFQFRGEEEEHGADEPTGEWTWCRAEHVVSDHIRCPYGKPGDRLWVREAWRVGKPHDGTPPRDILPPLLNRGQGVTVLYEAGGWRSVGPEGRDEPIYPDDKPMPDWAGKLRPAMFMPRAFSRISLEVTAVRVERLQEISEADAIAEGVEPPSSERDEHDWSICPQCGGTGLYDAIGPNLGVMPDTDCTKCDTHAKRYRYLWESINGEGSWDVNPWVWVVEFRIAPTQQGERP